VTLDVAASASTTSILALGVQTRWMTPSVPNPGCYTTLMGTTNGNRSFALAESLGANHGVWKFRRTRGGFSR